MAGKRMGHKIKRGRTYRIDVEITSIKNNWPIHVVIVKILERDVLDEPITNVWTCPSLESSAVLGVEHGDVFDVGVVDVVFYSGVLANTSHADAVGTLGLVGMVDIRCER